MFIFSLLLKKMHEVHLPLYFLAVVGVVNCQYYFVTAPNVIRFEHDETVVVSAFGLNYARVKVWLQYKGKKFSEKEVVVRNEAEPQTTTVRVKESDIFGISMLDDKPRTLQIYSEYQGTAQFRDVVISYKSGYLIVQTDKPIYTPQQKVKIRTLALEESLKPTTKQEVAMEIISPTNLTMARKSIPESESGFFQHEFTLPPYPDLGTWTARAFYKGQFETSARSLFQVKEYVLPTFEVTIDVDVPYILQSTDIIRVTVRAKYVYGKPVEGKVRLQLNLKDKLGSTEYIMNINAAPLQNTGVKGSEKEFTIETAKLLNSPRLTDRAFPDGSRLEVIATVFETATGKEEAKSNDNAMFTNNPYRFHFSRSKVNFRPGWEYHLKVEVTFANGKTAENQDVNVHIINNGGIEQTQVKKTGRDGQLVAIFGTIKKDKMTFRASIDEGPLKVESEDFVITPYAGKNQIQVESSTEYENYMTMHVFTNMDLNGGYTGMLFMVVTRGKVAYTLYEEPSNQKSAVISKKLQEYITPSARLLVFYVDKNTGELVADSVRFDIEQKCREELTLKTIHQEIAPGKYDRLFVKGSPFMWVGLNVMDKAHLLENDNNVLKKNKMFEALESHDLGCGDGSVKSSGDVFKKSGLTVLTNAVVSDEDLKRDTDTCTSFKRTKRSTYMLDDDDDYTFDLNRLDANNVQPYTRSDFRDSWLFEVVQLDYAGEYRQFVTYPDSITEWIVQVIGITEDNGMCIADSLDVKAYRDFFIQLDLPYKAVRMENLNLKATIFNYRLPHDDNNNNLVNVYIEGVEGLCFNTEPNKPSPRIVVDIPPNSAKTVTFPMIPLKAGVFPVKISAIVRIAVVDVVEKKLHVVNEGIEEKIIIQVCLDPSKDDEQCKNDHRVKTDVITQGDVAERILIVDLTLPENSISGTGVATGYIQSTRMDNIARTLVEGVETLVRPPSGNGEQMMMYLAPTVYALAYLQATKQVDTDIEVKGTSWVKYGIFREISQFRHADGAYAAWRQRPTSTWLTAFVAKIFCQANFVVDNAVNVENDLKITLKWLADHVQADGSFVDNSPVLHREMKGQINERDPSLTSFVLMSLLECANRSPVTLDVAKTIERARMYVKQLNRDMLRSSPYILALSTYALALTGSSKKWEFKSLLESQSHFDGREMYWGNTGGHPASANAVETTAYALLAMLKLNDFRSSEAIFRWLISQRGDKASLKTTQEIVVTLQALSTYMKMTAPKDNDVDLLISLYGYDWVGGRFTVTNETFDVLQIAENLPVERDDNRLTVKVKGCGYGTMMIDLRYNRPAMDDEICPFHITDIEASNADVPTFDSNIDHLRNCDVCGKCDRPEFYDVFDAFEKRQSNRRGRKFSSLTCIRFSVTSKTNKVHGMSIVDFGLETDVEVVQEDLNKLRRDNPNIVWYELPSSGSGFILFYLNQITPMETKFVFRLRDNFEGNIDTRQPSYIKVYDYNNQDQQCIRTYNSEPNKVQCLNFVCADGNREQCRCVQNQCAQPVIDKIERLVRNREQPALKLITYTCNPDKADYAVLVQIEDVRHDVDTKEVIARGIVIASIHTGIRDLIRGEEMAFFWKFHCSQVELVRGKKYYIIGKDGYMFNTGKNQEYRYPLMGTTLIIEEKDDKGVVGRVMDIYIKLMAQRGCSH